MKWTDSGGGTFENPEPGSYAAVCYKIIDIGTQEGEYQGVKNLKRQVIIGWELNELMTTGENAGKPFVVSKFYTASLSEKATLRHDLAGWRGRDFTADELSGFEDKNILGKSCMLSLTLTDKGKIRVSSVAKLPKGMQAPVQVNPTIYLSLEPDAYGKEVFEAQSDKMKALIMLSPEWQELNAPPLQNNTRSMTDGGSGFADFEDDIPF